MNTPLSRRVPQRPVFDNAALSSFPRWLEANQQALTTWWCDCDSALRARGGPAAAADDEFDLFCRLQYEHEVARLDFDRIAAAARPSHRHCKEVLS